MWRVASHLCKKSHPIPRLQFVRMWRVPSVFIRKYHLASPCGAALHTSPRPNSHLLNLTRVEVLKNLAVKSKTGFHRVDDARDLFHRMLQFQPLPFAADEPLPFAADDFSMLLKGVVKMKQFSSAVLIYRQMRFHGVPIDGCTMSIAVHSFCHLNQVDFGFAILGSIFKLGFKPDVVTLKSLIRGLLNADRRAEAVEVIQNFCVINGFYKSRNTFKAIQVLRSAEKEGLFKPNVVAYNRIIDCLFKERQMDERLQLLSQMAATGTPSFIITYFLVEIVEGFRQDGRVEEALELLSQMAATGTPSNIITHCLLKLVDAFMQDERVEEAEVMLQTMIERGECLDVVIYNSVMDGYCLRGEMDRAHQVLQMMVAQGCQPDIHSYSILIHGYCKTGKVDDALELFKAISCKGMQWDVVTFNTMIQGLLQGLFEACRCDDALELLKAISCKGMQWDVVTFNTIIQGLFKARRCDDAVELFKAVSCKGGDVVMFNTMIQELFKARRCDDARKLIVEMQNDGVSPNNFTYCIWLEGLCENGFVTEAHTLLSEVENNSGVSFDIAAYTAVMNGLCCEGKLSSARNLFDKLPSLGLKPNVTTFNAMIKALSREGLLENVKELLIKMRECGCHPNRLTCYAMFKCLPIEKEEEMKLVLEEMDQMVEDGIEPDLDICCKLIDLALFNKQTT